MNHEGTEITARVTSWAAELHRNPSSLVSSTKPIVVIRRISFFYSFKKLFVASLDRLLPFVPSKTTSMLLRGGDESMICAMMTHPTMPPAIVEFMPPKVSCDRSVFCLKEVWCFDTSAYCARIMSLLFTIVMPTNWCYHFIFKPTGKSVEWVIRKRQSHLFVPFSSLTASTNSVLFSHGLASNRAAMCSKNFLVSK